MYVLLPNGITKVLLALPESIPHVVLWNIPSIFKDWSDKFGVMRRRQFARMIGAGIVGMGLTSTATARSEGELPNDRVDTIRVHPFANDKENPITVPTGMWLEHSIGWVDTGEQNKADVQAYLDAVEYTAWIDGEEIENPDQYWEEIHWDEERQSWIVWWKYHTPPKKPGRYTYTSDLYFPDGFGRSSNPIPEGHRIYLKSYYEVSPQGNK